MLSMGSDARTQSLIGLKRSYSLFLSQLENNVSWINLAVICKVLAWSRFVKELNETLVFLSMEGLPQTFFAWWSYRSAEEGLIYKCYIIFLLFCIQYIYLARITWDAAIMKVVYTNLIESVKKIFKDNLFFHFDILQSILDIHWFCGNGSSSKH